MPGLDRKDFTSESSLSPTGGLLHSSAVQAYTYIRSFWQEKKEKSECPTEQGWVLKSSSAARHFRDSGSSF